MDISKYIADHAVSIYIPSAEIIDAVQSSLHFERFIFSVDKAQLIAQGLVTPEMIDKKMLEFHQDLISQTWEWVESKGLSKNGTKLFRAQMLDFSKALSAYHNSSFGGKGGGVAGGISNENLNDNLESVPYGKIHHFNKKHSPYTYDVEPHIHMLYTKNSHLGQAYNSILFGVAELARRHNLVFHFMEDKEAKARETRSFLTSFSWKIQSLNDHEFAKWILQPKRIDDLQSLVDDFCKTENILYYLKTVLSLQNRLARQNINNFIFRGYNIKESYPLHLSQAHIYSIRTLKNGSKEEIQKLLEDRNDKIARAYLENIAGFNNPIIVELQKRGYTFQNYNLQDFNLERIQNPLIRDEFKNIKKTPIKEQLKKAREERHTLQSHKLASTKMTLSKALKSDFHCVLLQARSEKEVKELLTIKGWCDVKIKTKNGQKIGIQITDTYKKKHLLLFNCTDFNSWPEIRLKLEYNSKTLTQINRNDTHSFKSEIETYKHSAFNNPNGLVAIFPKDDQVKIDIKKRRELAEKIKVATLEIEHLKNEFIEQALKNRSKNGSSQQEVFEKITQAKQGAFFLTGEGGSGKSFTTKKIIEAEQANGLQVEVLASTGIAAVNIGGRTLHSFFGIGICKDIEELEKLDKVNQKKLEQILLKIKKTDTIIIDEISMVHRNQMELINYRLKQAGWQGKLLFVGDFLQLPAIEKDKNATKRYAYESDFWQEKSVQTMKLIGNQRVGGADAKKEKFVEMLNRLRYGESSKEIVTYFQSFKDTPINDTDATFIFNTNREVAQRNAIRLAQLEGKEIKLTPKYLLVEGISLTKDQKERIHKEIPPDSSLVVKEGAQVILLQNDHSQGFVNGDRGVFIKEEEGKLKIKLDRTGKEVIIHRKVFESEWIDKYGKEHNTKVKAYPLRLAYAITTHKSQGMSLNVAQVSANSTFEFSQFYVAASRSSDPSRLRIDSSEKINEAIKIDLKSLAFMHPEIDFSSIEKKQNEIDEYENSLLSDQNRNTNIIKKFIDNNQLSFNQKYVQV